MEELQYRTTQGFDILSFVPPPNILELSSFLISSSWRF
jgi:hypothetical protein